MLLNCAGHGTLTTRRALTFLMTALQVETRLQWQERLCCLPGCWHLHARQAHQCKALSLIMRVSAMTPASQLNMQHWCMLEAV